jgi:DNA-binding NtrC family response regulator
MATHSTSSASVGSVSPTSVVPPNSDRTVCRQRCAERRRAFSEFLASVLAQSAAVTGRAALEAAFVVAVRRLVPAAHAVRIVPGAPASASRGKQVLQFSVPLPNGTEGCLEIDVGVRGAIDEWDRHLLRDAARVCGLVLSPRGQSAQGSVRPAASAASAPAVPTAPPDPAAPVIDASSCMRALRQSVERMAATDFTVLVEGESGSGKELVARQIHDLSARSQGPFIAVNCAALVETLLEAELFGIEDRIATGVRARRGKFEAADRGTLFLDEVADLSPAAQAKLLRAVQDLAVERVGGHNLRKVNIRLVVATNQSLRQLVDAGRFREDLYYRLAGVELQVPSLRKRRDDVLELAEYFLARHHRFRKLSLSDGAAEALLSYGWPGNVRELQRVIERAVALTPGHVVRLSDLPPELTREYAEVLHPSAARADSMRAWGSRYARLVLERCDRNKRRTCDVLGISYHTLQSYLRYRDSAGR